MNTRTHTHTRYRWYRQRSLLIPLLHTILKKSHFSTPLRKTIIEDTKSERARERESERKGENEKARERIPIVSLLSRSTRRQLPPTPSWL